MEAFLYVYWISLGLYIFVSIIAVVVQSVLEGCRGLERAKLAVRVITRSLSCIGGGLYLAGDNVELLWGNKIDRVMIRGSNGEEFRSYLTGLALLFSISAQFLPAILSIAKLCEFEDNPTVANDNDEKPLWYDVHAGLHSYIVLSIILSEYYSGSLDELTNKENSLGQVGDINCPVGPRNYGFVLFGLLTFLWVTGWIILMVGFYYLKEKKEYQSSCENKTLMILGIILCCTTLFFLPIYLIANNSWPWICIATNDMGDYFRARLAFQIMSTALVVMHTIFQSIKSICVCKEEYGGNAYYLSIY